MHQQHLQDYQISLPFPGIRMVLLHLLHDALGIARDKKIPASKLKDKPGDSPALKKKKLFARNARTWKHEEGGVVPFLFQGMEDLFGNLGDAADALVNPASALGGA